MKKFIKISEKIHKELKLYVVANNIRTFEDGIKELLSNKK